MTDDTVSVLNELIETSKDGERAVEKAAEDAHDAELKSLSQATHGTDAARKKGGSSAGVTGGVPATEEDIGTEGAGTEPRDTARTKRGTDSSSQRPQRDKDAA